MNFISTPFGLGYFLEETLVECFDWPGVSYRGVDRLQFLPEMRPCGDSLNLIASEPVELWERYLDSKYDLVLNTDLPLARTLRREFAEHGLLLDLIYTELDVIPDDIMDYPSGQLWRDELEAISRSVWNNINLSLGGPPADFSFLGFDISHPIPTFHSAIMQPGLGRTVTDLPRRLNANGLLDDIEDARSLLKHANAMDYSSTPFCILGVWADE